MRILKEPLIQFVIAAGLVFVLHAMWQTHSARRDATIFISKAEQERMVALYTAEAGSLPTEADMLGMLADHVRDEALSREARKLGLDEDDTIITRRLSQKMSFVVSDLNTKAEPTEEKIRRWYSEHPDTFTAPAKFTFAHVYLSPEKRGETVKQDATTLMADLNSVDAPDWIRTGDAFMLQRSYGELPFREAVRLFGSGFATAIADMPVSEHWQGPVRSAYGWHLVRLQTSKPATLIPLEEAREAVIADWKEHTRREMNDQAISEIIARYKVDIEGAP